MPHLDRLLLKSFIGPFSLAFAMAWFVLTMQFLWFFLEKIADKGLDLIVVLELIFYRSAGLIPLTTPLAALVASVMVIGGTWHILRRRLLPYCRLPDSRSQPPLLPAPRRRLSKKQALTIGQGLNDLAAELKENSTVVREAPPNQPPPIISQSAIVLMRKAGRFSG